MLRPCKRGLIVYPQACAQGGVGRIPRQALVEGGAGFFGGAHLQMRLGRHFPRPAAPSTYSRQHTFWAWLATLGMTMTAVTGWVFYWLAFVAK